MSHGTIELDAGRPSGLPFRQPLYGLGPYLYTDGMVLVVGYTCDEDAIRRCLPKELEPLEDNTIYMTFFQWPEVTGIGAHGFAMPLVPCKYGDYVGQWVPYLYTSTDASLACYRECQGWPAVLGDVRITEGRGKVHASVVRNGREIVSATAEVGGDSITEMDFLPIILYKEIPSIDGTTTDVASFLTSTSKFMNLDFRAGTGTVSFPDPGDDPIGELVPKEVTAVIYGSMDDEYPETIRLLEPLRS
ncbi:MAG: acetoacetate decarboxylase [Gaiellaceae bacterium]|jgi:acetoacetate decarboxylase|nr:acetoacetate decarboxylase [Gaiellaceae bacterium]